MYKPGPIPLEDKALREYLNRELRRISDALRDDAPVVFYLSSHDTRSLTAGDSANFRASITSNLTRVSTSNTVTLTGIMDTTPNRVRGYVNIGTGVLVLKNEGTESSASHRFALPTHWNLSANAVGFVVFDPISSRHRGLWRT